MTVSTENFLKTIYQVVYDYHDKASASLIAGRLNISNAAVTDMARKLAGRNLILYQKYRDLSLTDKGKAQALKVIRKHRLWELFLSKVFDLNITQVHHEAEMLEHQTSDFLLEKIDEYLDYPLTDPHGDPIPDKNGNIRQNNAHLPLSQAEPGKTYTIKRLHARSVEILKFLNDNDFRIGKTITVKESTLPEYYITAEFDNTKIILTNSIAGCIYISSLKPSGNGN